MKTRRAAADGDEMAAACHGLRIVLSVDDETLAPRLAELLPPSEYRRTTRRELLSSHDLRELRLGVTSRPRPAIEHDGTCVERPARLFDSVERHVDRLVAEHCPEHLALHAGVVGFGGGALLVVGASRSGKSTLVRPLVRSGGLYLSDDLAMIDQDLCVHPYPRPLRRRLGTRECRLDPTREFGRPPGSAPLPVRWILLPTYRPGARLEPTPLADGAAVLALLRHTFSARRAPRRALETLGRLVQTARVWTGRRGESRQAVDIVRRLVEFDP